MLLVHFLFTLLPSGFKRSDFFLKLVKLNAFFRQTNACSDAVGSGARG